MGRDQAAGLLSLLHTIVFTQASRKHYKDDHRHTTIITTNSIIISTITPTKAVLTRAGIGVAGLLALICVTALARESPVLRFRVGAGPFEGQHLGARAARLGTLAG